MAQEKGKKPEDFIDILSFTEDGNIEGYSCSEATDVFNNLIDDLYKKNESAFSSREEIFNLFARAAMTGEPLPWARLMRDTYGKDVFQEMRKKYEP